MADKTHVTKLSTGDVVTTNFDDIGGGLHAPVVSVVGAGGSGITITDGSGSLTVDGEVAITGKSKIIDVTLSLDTNAYADGDVLAAAQEVTSVVRISGGSCLIDMVELIDDDDQKGALDILFCRSAVDIGAENSAIAITDAEMLEIIGWIDVSAADYTDWGNQSTAYFKRGDSAFKASLLQPVTGTSIWIAAISRDSKTYSASGLKLKLYVIQD